MTWEELLEAWRFEYWATWMANPVPENDITFYAFLLTKANRWQLSAHGMGRDVEA